MSLVCHCACGRSMILAHLCVSLQFKQISPVKPAYACRENLRLLVCVTGIHDIHITFFQVSAGDNATMPQQKQAAGKGDGCSPLEGKPRAVLLHGLLSKMGRGGSMAPQVLLSNEREWIAIAAPLCMWPVSLCMLNSVQPACLFKGFVQQSCPCVHAMHMQNKQSSDLQLCTYMQVVNTQSKTDSHC